MFISLLIKECKYNLKSLTYYLIIILLILFYYSNDDGAIMREPVKGQAEYGWKFDDNEGNIMLTTTIQLANSMESNVFGGYPYGFYKEVKLSEEKLEQIKNIFLDITGLDKDQLEQQIANDTFVVKEDMTYEEFKEKMKIVDKILGGRSVYAPSMLKSSSTIPMTYEDALKQYNSIISEDKVSNAYARLFTDYMSILLGILPVFLITTRCLRDKRAQVADVIYTKKISSISLVLSRYLASVIMITIPVVIMSISPTLECIYFANSIGVSIDYFAFLTYIAGWILPTILFITAFGYLMAELTRSAIGILICGVFWIINIFINFGNLVGSVGMNLVPRFNTLGERKIFLEVYEQLIWNRSAYTVLTIIVVVITVIVYKFRREGAIGYERKLRFGNKG